MPECMLPFHRLSACLIVLSLFATLASAEDRIEGLPLGGTASVMPAAVASSGLGPQVLVVDPAHPGIAMRTEGFFGADLAIWNSPARYEALFPRLADAGFNWFRFPDGSLSNDYHWNGKGRYDSTGIWHPSATEWAPGFLAESKWRGTSKDNYGFRRQSHLMDGDTSTLWWGVVDDTSDPPWFAVDLREERAVDSVVLSWGALRPKSFTLSVWDSADAPYPGPHQRRVSHWKRIFSGKVAGTTTTVRLSSLRGRFFGIQFSAADIPSGGVQVRDVQMLPDAGTPMAKTWGTGTRPGDDARTDWTNIAWHFEAFMQYVRRFPNGMPVICVNLGTGTAEEAAAWVRYANKVRKYGVRDWQIGNENDGEWEEGGPLSALQAAVRFVAFAKAMKAVDPSIRIHGPLHSSDEWHVKGDGVYTGRTYMQSFLMSVAAAEKRDGMRYLDVVDFHTYPYWFTSGANPEAMMLASARPGPYMDTLAGWMHATFPDGDTRGVHLSEFGSTVVGTDLTMRPVQAASIAHLFAQFAVRFGDRGHALAWDTYGGWQGGPDGTSGSLRSFNPPGQGVVSDWGDYAPSTQYFGLWLVAREWMREGARVLPVWNGSMNAAVSDPLGSAGRSGTVRAFALAGAGGKSAPEIGVLLVNLSHQDAEVVLHRADLAALPIQVIRFGEDEYHWKGSDDKAFADPGNGPVSNRLPADSVVRVSVPANGISVVQWVTPSAKPASAQVWHRAYRGKVLRAGDTLSLWASLRQQEGALISAGYAAPFRKGDLAAIDGKWGGAYEGVRLSLPVPQSAQPGAYSLIWWAKAANGSVTRDTVGFRVRGDYRTVAVLDTFGAPGLVSPQNNGAVWFPYAHGNNNSSLDLSVLPGPPPLGAQLVGKFRIEQPANQTWPNFVAAHLRLDRELLSGKSPVCKRTAGIVFDYSTRHSSQDGFFQLLLLSDPVTDYDEYQVRLRNTSGNWVRDTLLWEDFAQEGWGVPRGILEGGWVKEFEFRPRGEGTGEFRLDNLYLLAEDGALLSMPQGVRRMR